MKSFLLKISRSFAAKKKIFSLFFALLTVSLVNAKVAFLVPADNTDKESMRLEKVSYIENEQVVYTEDEQSPERRAYDWFKTKFDESGAGQFICFNDLNNISSDINAIWIYVDRVGFNRDEFDALFTAERKAQLQAYLNAGGNLFLCKQATRLEKDLVGARNGQSSEPGTGDIIEPDYNDGVYRGPATMGVDYKFEFDNNVTQSSKDHRIYANAPFKDDNYAELIWSNGGKVTDNNCGIGIGAMGMGENVKDKDHLFAFQARNNCRVLGGWANGDGCHYGGVIEFYPTGNRKGTVLMLGLAAYQWISNNAGNGWENTKKITQNVLEYLDANPNLHWNEETIPTSGVINEQHIMTASANAGYTVRYYPNTDVEIANIGEADGDIYFKPVGGINLS